MRFIIVCLRLACFFLISASLAFWLFTLNQPLIDLYEFRQTQTALSARFLALDTIGIFSYQTPVVGYPWSIPFEFPFFQIIVSQLARISPLDLTTSGRLASMFFGIACVYPAIKLLKIYKFSETSTYVFVLLYFSSAIYLYWNRAFLIESTALFLCLSSIYLYHLSKHAAITAQRSFAFLCFIFALSIILALLVKPTTALPSFLLLTLDVFLFSWKNKSSRSVLLKSLCILLSLITAFFILRAWTVHSDSLKSLNLIGARHTSHALVSWNFGSLEQRLSPELWLDVIAKRMFSPIAIIPSLAVLVISFRAGNKLERKFIGGSLFLAFSPIMIFTNVHIVHEYYQSSCQIYLLLAIAGGISVLTDKTPKIPSQSLLAFVCIFSLVSGSLLHFKRVYVPAATIKQSEKLELGSMVNSETSNDSAIIVFGDSWSSAFAYHSNRRAFTFPGWQSLGVSEDDILRNPSPYIGDHPLGAIISKSPLDDSLLENACTVKKKASFRRYFLYLCS